MSENNISSNSISEINDGEDTMVIFSKEHTTSHYYNEVIEENNSERDAIKKVCNSFDAFCTHTTDVEYLIERYTELYNHIFLLYQKKHCISIFFDLSPAKKRQHTLPLSCKIFRLSALA